MQGFLLAEKVADGYFFEVLPARLHYCRRGAAAFGGPKARQTKARAGAKPRPLLCVRFAHPPPSLADFHEGSFQPPRKPGPIIQGPGGREGGWKGMPFRLREEGESPAP